MRRILLICVAALSACTVAGWTPSFPVPLARGASISMLGSLTLAARVGPAASAQAARGQRKANHSGITVLGDAQTASSPGDVSMASAQTAVVAAPQTPSNTAVPVISGTAQQGDTLSTSNGSWSGSPTSYSYQWQDCGTSSCTNISGATASSYTLQSSDVGDAIDVVATASNAGGSGSATSARTATVTAASSGGSGTGLHVSATDMPCPNSTAVTCADLLNANGDIVHMHGVDLSGTEYACIQGWGIAPTDGNGVSQLDARDAAAIAAAGANFVRIQLNEDCWLGINRGSDSASYFDASAPSSATPPTNDYYANAILSFIADLHAAGVYTEVVDMWNAPGTDQAVGQSGSSSSFDGGTYFGPDEDNSPAMWESMAETFANDPDTILSPAGEEDVSMSCQMNGCSNQGEAPNNVDGLGSASQGYYYKVAGLSQAVTLMREYGFKGPIALECAHYGGTCDCSQSGTSCAGGVTSGATWLDDVPKDSLSPSQIIAEVHNYGGGDFTNDGEPTPTSSAGAGPNPGWDAQYVPILQAGYPLFYGELGENYSGNDCSDDYVPHATAWADAYGVGYMDWTWTEGTGDCNQIPANYTGTSNNVATAASFSGNTTNASTSITSVSGTSGLQIGQVVRGSGLPAGDTIVSISGSTLTMGLESTATATGASLTAEQGNAGWEMAHDYEIANNQAAPLTNISRNATAYGYSNSGGSCCGYPASYAIDNEYGSDYGGGHTFDCTPSCGIALDLSGVPSGERQNVVVMWGNSSAWDPGSGTGLDLYDAPGNYTIDTNTAAGGSLPSSGWTTKVTVTGNEMGGRVAELDMDGANWLRINVTAASSIDASGNDDFEAKVDVLSDNSPDPTDTWLFMGDSTTENDMSWQDVNSSDVCCSQTDFMQSMHAEESQYYPTEFNDGIGSWPSESELTTNSDTGESYFQDALKYFGGHYIALDYGSTNLVSGDCSTFLANEMTMISEAIYDGFQPMVHYSPIWGQGFSSSDESFGAAIMQLIHGPALADDGDSTNCDGNGNTYLYMTYPTLLVGPDFWDFMAQNPSLADGAGGIHPTHPSGENAYRQLYVQAALFNTHAG